jgi:hypothetical protein
MKALVDKTAEAIVTVPGKSIIRDVKPLGAVTPFSTVNVAPLDAISHGQAQLQVGAYRGGLAYVDLDKAVIQPLIAAELLHILGKLDGRLEGYDLKTINSVTLDPLGVTYRGRLTVPAGQVWYLNGIAITTTKDATAGYDANFRCSLWPDVVATGGTPDADGQAWNASNHTITQAAGAGPTTSYVLFGNVPAYATIAAQAAVLDQLCGRLLRLPGGAVITLTITPITAPATAGTAHTIKLYGFVGKALVS